MLFDLRSKRRRGTVRVIYLGLALTMLAGLVLVGVGTGNNNGGLLNAFTNNGSSSGQSQLIQQNTEAALKATKAHPDSSKAWFEMIQSRWTDAGTGTNVNSTTGVYDKAGQQQLAEAAAAWQKYLSLTNDKPDLDSTLLAAKIYEAQQDWKNASLAWQYEIGTQPAGSSYILKGYQCTALNADAAKQASEGKLAAASALKLTPKSLKLEWKTTFGAAEKTQTTAEQDVVDDC